MRLSTAASLTILLATAACGQAQDSDVCCDVQQNCKNVSTMNITIKQFAERSPYYEPILSTDDLSVCYTSVCTTYFRIRDNLYLEFRSIELENGSLIISVHLVADLCPGVFRVQGLFEDQQGNSTTVHNTYVVDASCQSCQPLYMYYKCFFYDDCDDVNAKYDVVNGRSSSADNAPSCLDAFESLANSEGFNVQGFTRPRGQSYNCVVYFGKSTCLNYEQVDPSNRISYPLDNDAPSSTFELRMSPHFP